MTFTRDGFFAGFISLLLVLLSSATENPDLDIEEEVEAYVNNVAKKENNYVTWFDTQGTHPKLLGDPLKYKKYKVTSTSSDMKFSQPRKEYVNSSIVFSQMFENRLSTPSEVTLQRNIQHERVALWQIQSSLRRKGVVSLKYSMPKGLGSLSTESNGQEISQENNSSIHTAIDIETFNIKKSIKVPPQSSVKVEFVLKEFVQEIPWKAEIILTGWFAAHYYYKLGNDYTWLYPICKITHEMLESNCESEKEDGGYVKFISKGTVKVVKETKVEVKVSEHPLGPTTS